MICPSDSLIFTIKIKISHIILHSAYLSYLPLLFSMRLVVFSTFDMELDEFNVEFNTDGQNPVVNDVDVDDEFYDISACICSSTSYSCNENDEAPPQEENSNIFICLTPEAGVTFEVDQMEISKTDGDEEDPFSYFAIATGGEEAPFTFVETEPAGTTVRVQTQLLTGLFNLADDGTAEITGSGTITFITPDFIVTPDADNKDEKAVEFGIGINLAKGEGYENPLACLFDKVIKMLGM